MVNVAIVIGQLGLGGAERQVFELATRLPKEGYYPVVVTLQGDKNENYATLLRSAGITVESLAQYMPFDLSRLPRLTRLFRKNHCSIVHTYLSSANVWGGLAGLFARTPVRLASFRNADPHEKLSERATNHLTARLSHCLVSNTAAMKEILTKRDQILAEQIRVIPNGLSFDRFEMLPKRADARRQLGIAAAPMIVTMVARFYPQKDHETLLHAFAVANLPDTELMLVGAGPLRPAMEKLASNLGIHDRVHFMGARTDIPIVWAASDVGILATNWEGMPNSILEAMAAGRAVIGSKVGGVPEVIVDGETGLLVEPGDVEQLANAMRMVCTDADAAQEMGIRGRAHALSHFSVEAMVRATVDLYQELLSQRKSA